jgi:serine/threonine-protein kinase
VQQEAAAKAAEAERARLQQQAALKFQVDERTRRQVERQMRIARFVNNYEGGECFFVTPTAVAEDSTTLDGFGSSVEPFNLLDTEFKRANGFEANIGVHQVTLAQCAAVTFLSRLRNEPGLLPRLDIAATTVKSGGTLSGFVAEFGDRYLELILVTDDGVVYKETDRLRANGDNVSFTLTPPSADAVSGGPQLLFAIVSNAPLVALKAPRPGTAAEVFARVFKEARDTGQTINVSPKYFKLEK